MLSATCLHTATILPFPGLISSSSTDVVSCVLHTDATLKAVAERLDEVAKTDPAKLKKSVNTSWLKLGSGVAAAGCLSGVLRQILYSCGTGCIATAWMACW